MTAAVAIRLGTEGKATVKADFAEIGDAGDAAAARWKRSFDRAGQDVEAAMQRQANAATKLASIMPQTAMQQQVNAASGTGFGSYEGTARNSAMAFRELLGAQEQLEARTQRLLATIDPAWAAQRRFNAEMADARDLVSQGAISLDQYCDKLRLEKAALDQANAAQGRTGASAGQLRGGMQQLSYQIGDVAQQFALGTPPMVIFAQQGGQVIQAISLMQKESKGLIGFLGGPWGAVISGGALILSTMVSKLFETEDASKKAKDASADLAKNVGDLGQFFDHTTGKIKETNRALIEYAILSRQRAIDEARAKQQEARSAADAALRQSLRNRAPVFAERGLGRDAPATVDFEIERVLRGDPASIDAKLRALSRSTSSNAKEAGTILEQRAQFAMQARKIGESEAEIAQLLSGRMPVTGSSASRGGGSGGGSGGSSRAMDDAAARSRALAGDLEALEARYAPGLAVMRRYREEMEKIAALKDAGTIDGSINQIFTRGANDNFGKQILEGSAWFQQMKRVGEALKKEDADRAERNARLKEQMGEQIAAQGDNLTLARLELSLLGASDQVRERELNKTRLILGLKRDGVKEDSVYYKTQLNNLALLDEITTKLNKQYVARAEATDAMNGLIETAFARRNLEDFGDAGKRILNEMIDLAWKLALINPLKNWVTGSDLPTASGVFKALLGIGAAALGGGSGGTGSVVGSGQAFGNAVGTEWWRGGLTKVGENGEELVDLPRGSRVIPASRTRARLAENDRGPGNVTYIDARGADSAAIARLEAALREMNNSVEYRAVGAVADVQGRTGVPLGMG